MSKIIGIKSVDFKIQAFGHGVVNYNGPTTLSNEGVEINNHTLPKLRGYTNLTGQIKESKSYKYKKEASDIDFKQTPLYISQNCIRHHLFREQAYDLHFVNQEKDGVLKLLCSLVGLVRGYVVTSSTPLKRTSPLLLEDFVDQLGNGNFEQMGRSGSKAKEKNKKGEESSKSFFSKTTFGDTEYIAYGSISIEQLQFISLDNKFDRCAMIIKDNQGEQIAKQIQDFIQSLDNTRTPKATFHANYVRKGTIYEQGEAGILLDDVAIDILIDTTLNLICDLAIRQAKGYMYVDNIEVDYNDSNKMMRIKRSPNEVKPEQSGHYAVYFEAK
ncbi:MULTISPECIES: type I-Fv CRISPR-associated protein Cas7fv [unclassified Moraxella]|uniref:type I-Fv CRISPR-associated protein Cas7fv n=1 Tax=unclassified Moraxella TaxID=2685852 RepID=UPI00359D955D